METSWEAIAMVPKRAVGVQGWGGGCGNGEK